MCLSKERGLTLYGAYHFARRVLPLWLEGQYWRRFCRVGIAWGALDGEDVLPVLNQNEGKHHLCECGFSQLELFMRLRASMRRS